MTISFAQLEAKIIGTYRKGLVNRICFFFCGLFHVTGHTRSLVEGFETSCDWRLD
ncbi:hypothetical protein BDW02DRAFT_325873 [Decorospora gaudefroyi]|uniref:Uncharacterized protein n=1 Tax=Decorospora gaudefroyi TaxID=184978 RepID=A0A6A5KF91_9PLEO|nr:hypothetical protein BDW02DRAFT_325873 [Decorospora gaudefroyi]